MEKNRGILIAPPKPRDYILGSTSPLKTDREIKDWSIYLPALESQRNKVTDFLDCVTMSAIHSIEMQLNYLMATRQLSDEALYFFHNNHYIKDGLFALSVRFNAKSNGTDKAHGQHMNVAADFLRSDGFIGNLDWPTTDDMSDTLFYSDIPIGLFAKALKALWFVDIKYQWVDTANIVSSLRTAPLQVGTEICAGWDSGQTVQKCSGQPLQHATLVYGQQATGEWLNLDHYPPYKQLLAPNYELPLNLQYIVTARPLTLRKGMHGANVLQMQKDLNKLGFVLKEDSDFGLKTEMVVRSFQNKVGLDADGVAGPLTLKKIKDRVTPKTLLDAIIKVESGGDDNAIGDLNLKNHAYGCLQIRQGVCEDVNSFFGTDFKAEDCLNSRMTSLAIWNKYWAVYPLIVTNEDRARTWNGGPRWRKIYFKENKTSEEIRYCQNIDAYWVQVKHFL